MPKKRALFCTMWQTPTIKRRSHHSTIIQYESHISSSTMYDFHDFGLTSKCQKIFPCGCTITSKTKINIVWNFFFGTLHSKKFQTTLTLAFKANSALSRKNETKIVKITHSAHSSSGILGSAGLWGSSLDNGLFGQCNVNYSRKKLSRHQQGGRKKSHDAAFCHRALKVLEKV